LNQEFPNTKFRIVVADASDASNQQIQELVSSLSDIHLTILINNVGGGSVCKPLEDHAPREVDSMMNLNARFPIQITRALLSTFTKTSDPRLIMTIGSLGTSGVPYAVPYGGSKAFNMSMSASLDVEMRTEGKNVEVIGIPVGGVTEVGHRKDAATFFTPNGRTMARAALARVGCGRAVVIGYLGHAIQIFFLELLPRAVKESLVVPIMKRYKEEALRNK